LERWVAHDRYLDSNSLPAICADAAPLTLQVAAVDAQVVSRLRLRYLILTSIKEMWLSDIPDIEQQGFG